MGQRGPKKGALKALDTTVKEYPAPPKGMRAIPKKIWWRIVRSYPADHFRQQHLGILQSYCEAEYLNEKAFKTLLGNEVLEQSNGVTKSSPWVGIYLNTASTMAQLGTKLGITVNNTTIHKGQKGKAVSQKSKRDGLLYND